MGTAFRAKPVDIAAFRKSSPGRYPHGYPKMGALTPLLRATQSGVVRAVQSEQCQRDVFFGHKSALPPSDGRDRITRLRQP